MLDIVKFIRRTVEGSVLAIALVALVAVMGWSPTIDALLADMSAGSILFMVMAVVLLSDMIAKLIGILSSTFPDLLPEMKKRELRLASIIGDLNPTKSIALLSGAHIARIIAFLVIFLLLGFSYAGAPAEVRENLVGDYSGWGAAEAFLRESAAGAMGYFLFFLGSDDLKAITDPIAAERLSAASRDGDVFLSALRLYGLPFVLAVLRMLATPITFLRARLRARGFFEPEDEAPRAQTGY